MKVTIEIEVELPDNTMSDDMIKQEVSDHVLGDAMRYQAMMALITLRDTGRENRLRMAWSDYLNAAEVTSIVIA